MLFNHTARGFTLLQLMLTVAILAIISLIALPAYQHHVRKAQLMRAHAALLENAHFMERFYLQHNSFKQTSTRWPQLPITETDAFCIRPQGQAAGALNGKFMLKAVAFDQNNEPRTLKINEALISYICETTASTCSDKGSHFSGSNSTDKKCTLFYR